MKRKILFLLLFLSINIIAFSGCSDDVYDGELNVSFYNAVTDMDLDVYTIDNEEIPIYSTTLHNSKTCSFRLNEGNYILKLFRSNTFYPKIGFQIKIDSKTSIYYDETNSPTIKGH